MEDTNKQILDKLSNLENYIETFHNTRESQLIDKVNGVIGMMEYFKKSSESLQETNNELQKENNELFNEVCKLSKQIIDLQKEIAFLKLGKTL